MNGNNGENKDLTALYKRIYCRNFSSARYRERMGEIPKSNGGTNG
ncbi:hypothetical protein [Cricetibacter osteomyelitidis]|nr:hypothetical protein [Cricetibacter osteomyelitidis]